MCPYGLEIDISSSFFLHFWQGNSRKSQDLAWAACSVPRKALQAATNSEARSQLHIVGKVGRIQSFSQKSLTATVPKVFQIGLCGVVEADLELFCNSWSAGFLGERLY